MKIAVSAAEVSGDLIASSVIKSLKNLDQKVQIEGIAGEKMQTAGCKRLWNMSDVNVMGYLEVLKKLPQILKLRKSIIEYFSKNKPDVFVGFDSPDFNFAIETSLKQNKIKTIHCVSPSVWAWRESRIQKIIKSTDLMLCLFPFEVSFYERYSLRAKFIGHPLADLLSPRKNYKKTGKILIMPGSRESEIKKILPTLIGAGQLILKKDKTFNLHISLANSDHESWVRDQIGNQNISISIGDSHDQLRNSDCVMIASGTATLEALLIGVPMVVVYKLSSITYAIASRLVKSKFVSLPNVLTNKMLVPELIQKDANPADIADNVMQVLSSDLKNLADEFNKVHKTLQQNASEKAAKIIYEFANE